ncbi:hypothetical protein HPB49_002657 [Dermacentor silvarum]|uniref:Uncharacterized protein n=1 Tax=Dermacentor silvarum TaxID=543639 RepID=A0ACB8DAE7_DERSI|nr:hypothetical protein HPB49_002657 [Dermacentor silvarum]
MLRKKEPQRKVYVSRNGLLNLDSISSQTFRRQFRFEKAYFPLLVRALQIPECVTSPQVVGVSASEAQCTCLRGLAYPNILDGTAL